jgi:hypothetical protein
MQGRSHIQHIQKAENNFISHIRALILELETQTHLINDIAKHQKNTLCQLEHASERNVSGRREELNVIWLVSVQWQGLWWLSPQRALMEALSEVVGEGSS